MRDLISICLMLVGLFSFNPSKAQFSATTIKYYTYLNKADSFYFIAKDSNQALQNYISAFKIAENKLSIVSTEDKLKAIKLATSLNKIDIASQLFIYAVKDGLNIAMIDVYKRDEKELKTYFDSPQAKKVDLIYDSLTKTYLSNIDISFEKQLYGLYSRDQFSRNISDIPKLKSNMNAMEVKKINTIVISYSDCEIKKELFDILKSRKFKPEQNDSRAMGFVDFLLLHNLRNFEHNKDIDSLCTCNDDIEYYKKMQHMLYYLLEIGKESNTEYASSIDRAHCWTNFTSAPLQIYGTHLTKYNGKKYLMYPIKDIANVDKRRAEIYLPSLYEASIIHGFELPADYKHH